MQEYSEENYKTVAKGGEGHGMTTPRKEHAGVSRCVTLPPSDSLKAHKEIVNVFAVHDGSPSVKLTVAGEYIIARIDEERKSLFCYRKSMTG